MSPEQPHAVRASIGPMSDARVPRWRRAESPSRLSAWCRDPLALDHPEARLALSLHAPTQALREQIVPTATAYPLPKIMAALDGTPAGACRPAMIEYRVPGRERRRGARGSTGRVAGLADAIVNLIPFNPTDTPTGHTPPTREAVRAMAAALAGPKFRWDHRAQGDGAGHRRAKYSPRWTPAVKSPSGDLRTRGPAGNDGA